MSYTTYSREPYGGGGGGGIQGKFKLIRTKVRGNHVDLTWSQQYLSYLPVKIFSHRQIFNRILEGVEILREVKNSFSAHKIQC